MILNQNNANICFENFVLLRLTGYYNTTLLENFYPYDLSGNCIPLQDHFVVIYSLLWLLAWILCFKLNDLGSTNLKMSLDSDSFAFQAHVELQGFCDLCEPEISNSQGCFTNNLGTLANDLIKKISLNALCWLPWEGIYGQMLLVVF